MTTKLTLTMENGIIDSAKKYARENGKSLSDIVANYLKSVTTPEETSSSISPQVARLMGVIKLPDDFDYKKDLSDAIVKKYS